MGFVLSVAAVDGASRYRAGTKLADSTPNALPGDKISPTLCATPFAGMSPLDAAAVSALAAVVITTTIGAVIVPVTGGASIDA